MKRRLLIGILAGLILAGTMTFLAAAQSSPNFDLHWSILAGGGGQQTSANAAIQGALGQTAPGSAQIAAAGGAVQLSAGFYGPDLLSYTVFFPTVLR
jgi:hypothetical protein